MRKTWWIALSSAALVLWPLTARAADCPSEVEAQAAIRRYIETEWWSPTQREVWKISAVDGFHYSGFRTGRTVDKQVEYGVAAVAVCPVPMEYSFQVTHADGRVETTEKGKGETFFFYRDSFDDWLFKVGS